ncbi:MAG: hypothetical protein V4527_14940 [Pseudomonadota bacterium]
MFTTVKNETANAQVSAPTITDIARGVPMGAALQMADANMAALRKQGDEIGAELTCAIAERDSRHGGNRTEINRLSAEGAALDAKIVPVRARVMELRLARSRKVADALAPRRLEAAHRLIAAIDELAVSFNELRSCCEEIRRAGDPDQEYFHPPVVGLVLAHAERIIRLAK